MRFTCEVAAILLLQYESLIRNVLSLYPFQKNRLSTVVLIGMRFACEAAAVLYTTVQKSIPYTIQLFLLVLLKRFLFVLDLIQLSLLRTTLLTKLTVHQSFQNLTQNFLL